MESKILEILSGKNKSLTIMEINDLLGLHTIEEYQELEKTLNILCMEAQIYYSEKKKRYTLFSNTNYMKGKLIVNPKGYGFVILDDNDKTTLRYQYELTIHELIHANFKSIKSLDLIYD